MMSYTGKVTSAESLGRILQQARLLSGLSQRELANRLGTTQKYIWELEAGQTVHPDGSPLRSNARDRHGVDGHDHAAGGQAWLTWSSNCTGRGSGCSAARGGPLTSCWIRRRSRGSASTAPFCRSPSRSRR